MAGAIGGIASAVAPKLIETGIGAIANSAGKKKAKKAAKGLGDTAKQMGGGLGIQGGQLNMQTLFGNNLANTGTTPQLAQNVGQFLGM